MSLPIKDYWGYEKLGSNDPPAYSPISMNNWGDTERHRQLQNGGSPILSSHEETLNSFVGGNGNSSYLPPSSCQDPDPASLITNFLHSFPDLPSQKNSNDFFGDDIFSNGCSDIQQHYQNGESRNEGNFHSSDPTVSYAGPVSKTDYNLSSSIDPSTQSAFGVLPHQAVKLAANRSIDTFAPPESKPIFNGSYPDWENNVPPNPLSVSSSISADTATPSPQTATLTPLSSNLSPGSTDNTYSPPNVGAYKPIASPMTPMTPSPSLVHHSYPPSPYANLDPISHMSGAPPCSPMNGGPYVNNLNNNVPGRNGLQKQQLPTTSNGVMPINNCYTPQSIHGPMPKTQSDYHNDFSPFANDRISPTYSSSGYVSHPSSRVSTDSAVASPSPRGNTNYHETQMRYNHLRTVPPAPVSSPKFQQTNSVGHEMPYQPPTNMQPPPSYRPGPPAISSHSYKPAPSSAPSTSAVENDPYVFPSAEMVDDQGALEMFNGHMNHGPSAPNPYPNYTDSNLRMNTTNSPRSLSSSRPGESRPNRTTIYNRGLVQPPVLYREPAQSEVPSAMSNYYNSGVDASQLGNPMFNAPKRRGGRRGRRRGGNTGCRGRGRGRGQSYEKDKSVYFPSISRANAVQQIKQENDTTYYSGALPPPTIALNEPNNQNINSVIRTQMRRYSEPYGIGLIKTEFTSLTTFFNQRMITRKSANKSAESPYVEQFKNFLQTQHTPRPGEVWPCKEPPKEVPPKVVPPKVVPPKVVPPKEVPPKVVPPKVVPPKVVPPKEVPPKEVHSKDVSPKEVPPKDVSPKEVPPKEVQKSKDEKYCNKILIKLDHSKKSRKWWKVCEGTYDSPVTLTSSDENNSNSSAEVESDHKLLPSHKIKQEAPSEEECSHSVEISNSSQLTKKQSQKSKAICVKEEPDVDSSIPTKEEERSSNDPPKIVVTELDFTQTKVLGKNTPTLPLEEADNRKKIDTSLLKVSIKTEDSKAGDRLKILRSCNNTLKEPKPGPSTREDSPDYISDRYENFDDSDSDPAWTPSAKSAKANDTSKAFAGPSRKRVAKGGRKTSGTSNSAAKKKAAAQENVPQKKRRQAKPKAPPAKKAPAEAAGRGRKETGTDRFLIAKADINLPTPFIWKVDRKSSMLQRFEASEQDGVHLYRSSFTYAAGNQFCVSNYVTADVKALSPDTVQYLGPNLSETAEMALSEIKPGENDRLEEDKVEEEEDLEPLREDFAVYVQSLLSQDMDSTFLEEIKRFNDNYFLVPIENIETFAANKKAKILKEFWDGELKDCIDSYPHVNVLDSAIEGIICQACKKSEGDKLLQFYGGAYDRTTLGPMDTPNPTANQFSVCDNCSISISLYNRLLHQKYTIFEACHSKASEVKANNDTIKTPEDVLKVCLEDSEWMEKIFDEYALLWKECEKNS